MMYLMPPCSVMADITSNLALSEAPGNVRIGKSDSKLASPATPAG
jgi:hypothetical protein